MRQDELAALSKEQSAPAPLLHSAIATRYRRAISDLRKSLNQDGKRQEASEHLRGLVEKIVLTRKTAGKICR